MVWIYPKLPFYYSDTYKKLITIIPVVGYTIIINEQMESLIVEFAGNKKLHPIERVALFHLKFEGIHPFVDGNGRTERLILNLMLMQAGYTPINVKYSNRKR